MVNLRGQVEGKLSILTPSLTPSDSAELVAGRQGREVNKNASMERRKLSVHGQGKRPDALFPIGYVSRASGLSTHVIRAWERRYGIVNPARSSKKRRLYTQEDLDYLISLKNAVSAGHSISRLAKLERGTLAALTQPDRMQPAAKTQNQSDETVSQVLLEASLTAVIDLDPDQLEQNLSAAAIQLPRISFLTGVVSPLLEKIGGLWAEGTIKVIHEHEASPVIHGFLWDMLRTNAPTPHAPAMVVTTPAGQWCDLGALMAAIVASECGWAVHYFGPSLPSDEIVAAVWRKRAQAVALSIACRMQDVHVARELKRVRRGVAENVRLFVGGRASATYRDAIEELRGIWIPDLNHFVTAIS